MVHDSMGLYFSFITPSIHKFCPVRPRKKVHTFASPYGPESGSLRVLEFLWFTFATFCRPNVQTRRTVRLATAERYIALRCFPPISFVLLFHRRRLVRAALSCFLSQPGKHYCRAGGDRGNERRQMVRRDRGDHPRNPLMRAGHANAPATVPVRP